MFKKAIVEMNKVSFQYNDSYEQLKQVDLTIYEGECVVVTGPSGSGKTTLTRLLNGLIPNFYEGKLTGTVTLRRKNISEIEPWSFGRFVGSVFQDSRSQFFTSIVEDEIAFSGENYGMAPELIRERLGELTLKTGIAHLLPKDVHRLSSGEKQKVAVASARLTEPEIYVMDEPSANLDMRATKELAESLSSLKERGSSIIIAEHRLYYLLPIADRIIYMSQGEITEEWTPAEMLALTANELEFYGLRSPVIRGNASILGANRKALQERVSLERAFIAPGKRKQRVLEDISCSFGKGEVTAITGPNGVGKTTFARTLCGLIREQAGTIQLNGKPVRAKKRLGKMWFVMQDSDYQLFSDSVYNELLMTHEKDAGAAERAESILKELDLWAFREHHPASLSGGQKQRLTFAVGLMNKPDMIILDEPTSGLDGRNMRRVVKLIRQMASSGVTVLVITHDYELVCGACDRLLFFQEKKLQADISVTASSAPKVIKLMETLQC
ncbi:energy-coupling factor transport system ATP-binding protein [Fontibacillus panacisegetis]|uniref:Energy-coupling factor transport system ATP-binding protein n=1 Tax=Fontibacillus panacisegetis TaxID=670482 RepID=A0A1G7RKF0_9BACL|nr:energy-coupling factor ABC transporter ATP-binding protein [Fontibacillus panacisegetis]SDG11218.1 energy-coupling factor transport system ATP-binding protein [Fontibacillus panacisegetis]